MFKLRKRPIACLAAARRAGLLAAMLLIGCAEQPLVDSLPRPDAPSATLQPRLATPTMSIRPKPLPPAATILPAYASAAPVRPPVTPQIAPAPRTFNPEVPGGANWSAPAGARAWRYIVIHHSASESGNAALFDREHRARGWDELGYHFVIGNGTGSGDGQIEVGPRWIKQKYGAHAKTADERYNQYGIGICLVGNFDLGPPDRAQMQASATLVAYLMKTYNIRPENVIGHRDTKATDCPGKFCSVDAIRRLAVAQLQAGGPGRAVIARAGDELMR